MGTKREMGLVKRGLTWVIAKTLGPFDNVQTVLINFVFGFPLHIQPIIWAFYYPGYLRIGTYRHVRSVRRKWPDVTFRQAIAFRSLVTVRDIVENIGGQVILQKGALLGSVRQRCFAGKPGDIDLTIISHHPPDYFFKMLMNRGRNLGIKRTYPNKSRDGKLYKIYFKYFISYDVNYVFLEDNPTNNDLCVHAHQKLRSEFDSRSRYQTKCIQAMLFDEMFEIPLNFESILRSRYGDSWSIPDKHQYKCGDPVITYTANLLKR